MCNATVAVPGCEEVPRAEEGFIFIGNIESVTLTGAGCPTVPGPTPATGLCQAPQVQRKFE